MIDREKVITGVDICLSRFHCGKDCPYYNAGNCSGCMELLRKDALELLKDQETTFDDYYGDYKCSACETIIKSEIRYMADNINYCPNCGRKAVK